MAGDFYTLGEIERSELKVMAFPPRQENRIKKRKKKKSLAHMIAIVISVIAPFVAVAALSEYILTVPVLYIALVMGATSYFTLFVISNKHFLRR